MQQYSSWVAKDLIMDMDLLGAQASWAAMERY
jgi:hypothetical protein